MEIDSVDIGLVVDRDRAIQLTEQGVSGIEPGRQRFELADLSNRYRFKCIDRDSATGVHPVAVADPYTRSLPRPECRRDHAVSDWLMELVLEEHDDTLSSLPQIAE